MKFDGMAWQRCFQRWPSSDGLPVMGYIRSVEIIPAEQKSKTRMNLAGGNNPCGTEKQGRDEFGRWK